MNPEVLLKEKIQLDDEVNKALAKKAEFNAGVVKYLAEEMPELLSVRWSVIQRMAHRSR